VLWRNRTRRRQVPLHRIGGRSGVRIVNPQAGRGAFGKRRQFQRVQEAKQPNGFRLLHFHLLDGAGEFRVIV
jgi:hypothetical protein